MSNFRLQFLQKGFLPINIILKLEIEFQISEYARTAVTEPKDGIIFSDCCIIIVCFVEDIIDSDASCIDIAQQMLQMPIERAFECLSKVVEE